MRCRPIIKAERGEAKRVKSRRNETQRREEGRREEKRSEPREEEEEEEGMHAECTVVKTRLHHVQYHPSRGRSRGRS
jgi:hypothetical protein